MTCVALPVWAVAGRNLDVVAGWANILALPVTVLGLVFVAADRVQGRVAAVVDSVGVRRRPWMAPPLDRMVQRPELAGHLVAALTSPGAAEVGLTTALHGAGGFGKTYLATWACHQPQINQRYPGGLLWATIGQDVHGADLAVRVNDLTFALSGQRPALSDPEAAGAELGRLLDERDAAVLLVVDDVWEAFQLRPFRIGGRSCTRLVTTRIPDLLPMTGARIPVDAMSGDQARQMIADGVSGLPADDAEQLAELAGRWPVLLNLVNRVLRHRIARGQPPVQAVREVVRHLLTEGPVAFDPARPADRSQAVAATIGASLALLGPADQQRYFDLAIFPEDVDIPLDVLGLLWPGRRAETLCEELAGLGLAADFRLDEPGARLVLHDVVRAYLRSCRNAGENVQVHRRLADATAGLLPAGDEPVSWWLLPDDAGYLWRYLPYHLREAGRDHELAELVTDLRWVEAKTRRFGSVVAAQADLELVDTPTTVQLRWALSQATPLLSPMDPPSALSATLASRLHGVPGLELVVRRYRATLPRPLLEPAWPLPDQPDPAQPVTPAGHIGGVIVCAFSPGGVLLATAGDDGTVRLWRVVDWAEHRVLIGHTGSVWGCAFSPDGALLATTSTDRTARLWQVATGAPVGVLHGHTDWVRRCEFSPDGALLATVSADRTVRLWRVADGTEHAVLTGHTDGVWDCAFSPDNTVLATASDDLTVRLWQVADGTERATLRGHTRGVLSCTFSPGGTLLATASRDQTARLWRVADGTEQAVLTSHAYEVNWCRFSADGTQLATVSDDGTARLWRVDNWIEQAVLTGHTDEVWTCEFSPDDQLLATTGGENDRTVRLWRVADGTEQTVLTGRGSSVQSCAFSPDGALLAISSDRTTRLWRIADRTEQAELPGHTGRVLSCAFSPDGALFATTSHDRTARLWRVADGTEQAVLTGHTSRVHSCAFSPDGTLLATSGNDRTARLWQVADGTEQAVLTGHTGWVRGCAFSPDGALLATTGTDWTVRLWRIADGTERGVLTGHTDWVRACAFSPDGALLATTSHDRTVRLWRVTDGTQRAVLTGHTSFVQSCAFSPDGTLLATASRDGTVRLWQVDTGRCHCALRVAGPLFWIAWHPNGALLCTIGAAGIYVLTYYP
jgi:WD40 repeat protein